MSQVNAKAHGKTRRQARVRSRLKGTSERPRMNVHISNVHVSAQIIDDSKNATLASVSTVNQKISGSMTEKAAWAGEAIAKAAKTAKIKQVVLDRNGRLYKQRLSALAEAARKGGLEF